MTNAVMGRCRPSSTSLSTVVLIRGSALGVVSVPAMHDTFSLNEDIQL